MNFPEQLKAQRERLGLTQAELASFLDVSPRAVWQWEKGTLPHVLTQEGALARLTKAKRRTQGTNHCETARSRTNAATPDLFGQNEGLRSES